MQLMLHVFPLDIPVVPLCINHTVNCTENLYIHFTIPKQWNACENKSQEIISHVGCVFIDVTITDEFKK